MISTLVKDHLPEWLEVGTIVFTLVVGAITSAGITLYRVDAMADDVTEIKKTLVDVPVLMKQIKTSREDYLRLDKKLDDFRIHDLEAHHGENM